MNNKFKKKIYFLRSPGYGLTLTAETKNGSVISAESCSIPRANEGDTTTITIPEELAKEAVFKLFDEIYQVKRKEIKVSNEINYDILGRCC